MSSISTLIWRRFEKFLLDFGLLIVEETPQHIYFRGYGNAPIIYLAKRGAESQFVGVGFKVTSETALKELAARFDATIEPSPLPGGGNRIVISDPDGKRVELVFGARTVDPMPTREPLEFNSGGKIKRLRPHCRFSGDQPVPVLGLCHAVMSSPDPQRLMTGSLKSWERTPPT